MEDRTDMNVADVVILSILLVSVLIGLFRGLVGEVLSLVRWVAAFWISAAFGAPVGQLYSPWLHSPEARIMAGSITCFVAVLLVAALVMWLLRRVISFSHLSTGDSLLGMLFGLARGLLLVTFGVLMLGFTPVPRQAAWWQQSQLLPGFVNGAAWLAGALPPEATHYLEMGRSLPAVPKIPISTLEQAARQLQPGAQPAAAASTEPAAGHDP